MKKKNNDQNPQLTPDEQQWLDELLEQAAPDAETTSGQPSDPASEVSVSEALDLESILAENWDSPEELPEESGVSDSPEAETQPMPEADMDEADFDPDAFNAVYEGTDGTEYDEDMQEETEEVKKSRPPRRKGSGLLGIPHVLSTVIWLCLILAIGISLGRTLWVCTADLMAFGKEDNQVTITITAEDNIDSVSKKLAEANLIRYPGLFKTFAELTGKDERISAGTFTLNSRLDYNAMINAMGSNAPAREEVEIMFPEGYNCAQIFKLLEEKNVCSAKDLEEYAASGELDDYWFLEGVPRGTPYCLEGYLAPDTYKFYTNDKPERVLEKFLDEFDSRFTDKMHEKLEALQKRYRDGLSAHGVSADYIDSHPMNLHSVITLASIIEKESANKEESFRIASVFLNRLMDPKNYPTLDSDATVYYAIGDYYGETKELTQADLNSDSPYNTRKAQGLPPGPICNTGVNSIYAALDPESSNYYYFVFDKKESHHLFASTYQGHQDNLAKIGG